jgi:hypothetical protein
MQILSTALNVWGINSNFCTATISSDMLNAVFNTEFVGTYTVHLHIIFKMYRFNG